MIPKYFERCAAKWGNRPREEQIALRVYNLEQAFGKEEVVDKLKWACNNETNQAFDDEFWMPGRYDNNDMIYIQVVQIVRCFGKELTLRFLSFNFKEELDRVG